MQLANPMQMAGVQVAGRSHGPRRQGRQQQQRQQQQVDPLDPTWEGYTSTFGRKLQQQEEQQQEEEQQGSEEEEEVGHEHEQPLLSTVEPAMPAMPRIQAQLGQGDGGEEEEEDEVEQRQHEAGAGDGASEVLGRALPPPPFPSYGPNEDEAAERAVGPLLLPPAYTGTAFPPLPGYGYPPSGGGDEEEMGAAGGGKMADAATSLFAAYDDEDDDEDEDEDGEEEGSRAGDPAVQAAPTPAASSSASMAMPDNAMRHSSSSSNASAGADPVLGPAAAPAQAQLRERPAAASVEEPSKKKPRVVKVAAALTALVPNVLKRGKKLHVPSAPPIVMASTSIPAESSLITTTAAAIAIASHGNNSMEDAYAQFLSEVEALGGV